MKIIRTGGNGRRSLSCDQANLVFTSGITTTNLTSDTKEQTADVLAQIDRLLHKNGTDKTKVLKATVYLSNMDDYGEFNSQWDQWVNDGFEPAREVTQARLALDEYKVKISVIAAK